MAKIHYFIKKIECRQEATPTPTPAGSVLKTICPPNPHGEGHNNCLIVKKWHSPVCVRACVCAYVRAWVRACVCVWTNVNVNIMPSKFCCSEFFIGLFMYFSRRKWWPLHCLRVTIVHSMGALNVLSITVDKHTDKPLKCRQLIHRQANVNTNQNNLMYCHLNYSHQEST